MKKTEKQRLLLLIVVGIIIVGIIYFVTKPSEDDMKTGGNKNQANDVEEQYVQELEDGTKLNTSTKLNETKTVDGLEIGNIQLTMKNGETKLLADVKNNSGKDIGVRAIDIILYNENGKELVTINGVIGSVKIGQTVKLEASTTLDFANAYDFKVVIK